MRKNIMMRTNRKQNKNKSADKKLKSKQFEGWPNGKEGTTECHNECLAEYGWMATNLAAES